MFMKRYLLNLLFLLVMLTICCLASAEMASTQAFVTDLSTGLPAKPASETSAMAIAQVMEPGDCAALWDTSHGVYLSYEPSGYYSQMVSLLESQGYTVAATSDGFLDEDLGQYRILIVNALSSWDSAYSAEEVTAITNFVDNGGKLLIIADNAGCNPAHINPVSNAFGTTVGLSTIEDTPDIYLTNLATHPAFTGVSSIYMRMAGEINAIPPSEIVAWDDSGRPLLSVVENEVFIIGDGNLFENIYFGNADNEQLALNIWQNVFCTAEEEPEPETTPVVAPEFPGLFIPVTFIIGFICVVLLARTIREH
jgi:hypothetical protein